MNIYETLKERKKDIKEHIARCRDKELVAFYRGQLVQVEDIINLIEEYSDMEIRV